MRNEVSLSKAIENLYGTFAGYPLRKHVDGCPCCVSNRDKRRLERKPLRELSRSDLSKYAFKAMTTWGDEDDFRHFLPRVLELLVSRHGLGWDEEIVLGKLALARWREWPAPQQSAVRDYLRAGWEMILRKAQPRIAPDSWLCGLGRAAEDLRPYLSDWMNSRDTNAYEHLATFIEWNEPAYIKRHSLSNAFWPDSPTAVAQVCDWLCSPATREELDRIWFEDEHAPFAGSLARAIDELEQIARA